VHDEPSISRAKRRRNESACGTALPLLALLARRISGWNQKRRKWGGVGRPALRGKNSSPGKSKTSLNSKNLSSQPSAHLARIACLRLDVSPWCSRRPSCASTTASSAATRTTSPRACRCAGEDVHHKIRKNSQRCFYPSSCRPNSRWPCDLQHAPPADAARMPPHTCCFPPPRSGRNADYLRSSLDHILLNPSGGG
jgi:hypothetical protein